MALYSNKFETPSGDKLDFSVMTGPTDISDPLNRPEWVSLTIFKTPEFHTHRRKVFGCKLSSTEWRRLLEWLPGIGG